MNLTGRLEKIENIKKEKDLSIEIITFNENENSQDKLREREKKLYKKIDIPIFIKIIPCD